jgi:DNA-3-methyladenine glycosylase II
MRQDELERLPDDEVIARLTTIRGIGRWSAEWVLARTLGRACVVAGDLGVRKAVGLAYVGTALPSEADVRRATAHWGDAAGTAQALLLHALGEGAL